MKIDWNEYKMWRRVCAAMAPDRVWLQSSEVEYNTAGQAWKNAKKRIGSIRGSMKYVDTRSVKRREREIIITEARTLIKMNYPRIDVGIDMGSPARGDKGHRSVSLKVGFMWHRTVNKNLYLRGFKDDNWFILKADRYKINVKNVLLYECRAFNIRTGENKDMFVGEALTDEGNSFYLCHSAKSALDNAYSHVSKRLTAMIKGELNDQ